MNHLKTIAKISGKPIMISEFQYGEPKKRQTGAVEMMDNEQQKGMQYHNHGEHLAASGFVVERIGFMPRQADYWTLVPGIIAGLAVGFSGLPASRMKFLSSVMKTN
jgi:hypothetical protein